MHRGAAEALVRVARQVERSQKRHPDGVRSKRSGVNRKSAPNKSTEQLPSEYSAWRTARALEGAVTSYESIEERLEAERQARRVAAERETIGRGGRLAN